jgi:hypothetical protein
MTDPIVITSSLLWQFGTLVAGAVLTALLLAVGHWFPWPRRLSRLDAYGYGTIAIFIGFALWRLLNRDSFTAAGFAFIATIGGITVILAYKIDDVVLAIRKVIKAQSSDPELAADEELD